MRALVFGLLGVALATGAAEARACKVDGAVFKAMADNSRPVLQEGMEGSTFRVVKASSKFTAWHNPANGDDTTPGELYMLLKGKRGTYLVTSFYAPGSVPSFAGVSDEGAKAPPVRWGVRDRAKERKFSLAADFPVMVGPLQGYELQNLTCK